MIKQLATASVSYAVPLSLRVRYRKNRSRLDCQHQVRKTDQALIDAVYRGMTFEELIPTAPCLGTVLFA
jgi:hypothetical protein